MQSNLNKYNIQSEEFTSRGEEKSFPHDSCPQPNSQQNTTGFTPSNLESELKLTAGALHYAESIAPGVASRVSLADGVAIMQGTIRSLLPFLRNQGGLSTLAPPDIRVGPSESYMAGIGRIITSIADVAANAALGLAGSSTKTGALRSGSVPGGKPSTSGSKSPRTSRLSKERSVTTSKETRKDKKVVLKKTEAQRQKELLLAKALRSLKTPTWSDICKNGGITDASIKTAVEKMTEVQLLDQDKSIPPLVRLGLVNVDDVISSSWAATVDVRDSVLRSLRIYKKAASRLRDVFPQTGKPHRKAISSPLVDIIADQMGRRKVVTQMTPDAVREVVPELDGIKIYVNLASVAPKDAPGVYPAVITYKNDVNSENGSLDRISKSRTWILVAYDKNKPEVPVTVCYMPSREAAVSLYKKTPGCFLSLDVSRSNNDKVVDNKRDPKLGDSEAIMAATGESIVKTDTQPSTSKKDLPPSALGSKTQKSTIAPTPASSPPSTLNSSRIGAGRGSPQASRRGQSTYR